MMQMALFAAYCSLAHPPVASTRWSQVHLSPFDSDTERPLVSTDIASYNEWSVIGIHFSRHSLH